MTTPICSFNNYFPYCWDEKSQQDQWPITHLPRERLLVLADTSHPELYFSPVEGAMPVWQPTKRRSAVDRFCHRLKESNFTGSDLAIEYLREKYSHNLAASTLKQSGGIVLSFLGFLGDCDADIRCLTRKDISGYVERDQDNGLTAGAIRTKLRALYTFIHFLVERGYYPTSSCIRKSASNQKNSSPGQSQLKISNLCCL